MSIFSKIFIGFICGLILYVGLPQKTDTLAVDNLTELVEFEMEKEKLKVFTYQEFVFKQKEFSLDTAHEHILYVWAIPTPLNEVYLPPPKV